MKQLEKKENTMEKRTDTINNDNLKENAVVLIGNKKCCIN